MTPTTTLDERLRTLTAQADARLDWHRQRTRALEIRRQMKSVLGKTPVRFSGLYGDGYVAETPYVDAESLDLEFELPSRRVSWNLRPGRYRVRVELDRDAALRVYDREGRELVPNREGRGFVFDVNSGSVQLIATEPIVDVDVMRFTRRGQGEIVLGPFASDGVVSAEVVGDGTWTTSVAYDYPVWRTVELTGDGRLELQGAREPAYAFTDLADVNSTPWSRIVAFDQTLPEPVWQEELEVGRVYTEPYDIRLASPTKIADADLWVGVGRWEPLSAVDTPSFLGLGDTGGVWTYLWGRVKSGFEHITHAFSTSGHQVTPTATRNPGFWLLRRQASGTVLGTSEDPVVLDGVWGSVGEPCRRRDDELAVRGSRAPLLRPDGTAPPGSYRVCPYNQRPRRFLVRVRGAGVLRSVRVTTQSQAHSPSSIVQEITHHESIAHYLHAFPGTGNLLSGAGLSPNTLSAV